jgi:xanthine dehydrogenase iron-sulfur cluster and FAD-binding subunit A
MGEMKKDAYNLVAEQVQAIGEMMKAAKPSEAAAVCALAGVTLTCTSTIALADAAFQLERIADYFEAKQNDRLEAARANARMPL